MTQTCSTILLKIELFSYHDKEYTFKNAWTAFGHSARIWKCNFFKTGIVTCAEDATVIVWGREGVVDTRLCGHEIKMCGVLMHRGMESWQSQVGDGSVKLWDLGRYSFAASISFMLSKSGAELTHLLGKHWMAINNFKV